MKSMPSSSIRPQVQEAMSEFAWLDSIRKDDEINSFKSTGANKRVERCMICTLPLGSCEHTSEWKDAKLASNYIDNNTELEIDSALDVLGDSNPAPVFNVEDDVDLDNLCWEVFEDRPVDRIGETKMGLFTPVGRYWFTTTKVGEYLVSFGGLRIRIEKAFHDIRLIEDSRDLECLNDLRVYNISRQSWHGVRGDGMGTIQNPIVPTPRYGHCAAAVDETRLIIFGGKGENNVIYGDTWIYNILEDTWEEVRSVDAIGKRYSPSPRVHSAMTSVSNPDRLIFLFGGTNEEENLADLWKINPKTLIWQRVIMCGSPPSPRYGHSMIPIENERTFMIIGGCTISPQHEYEGTKMPHDISMTAMNNKYQSLLDQQFIQLNKKLRGLSTTDYRIAEEKLYDSWKDAKAMNYYLKKNARHTNPVIDLYWYNIQEGYWEDRNFPKISGEIPKSRIYFGVQCISHFLFLVGGCYPTSLMTKCVDEKYTEINVFDLFTHTWTKPLPINSDQYFQQTLLVAEADIVRAQNHLKQEKLEGLSLGAPGGITKEVAIAQMMLNVCLWRKEQLEKKKREGFLQPDPTIAMTFTALRQRLIFAGGFTPGQSFRRDILALSVEHMYERERRLQEMYDAKLALDRKDAEARAAMENLISAYELRAKMMEERRNRERELRDMALADYLSSLPPLTMPKPVRLVKANHHTIWVSWEKISHDSSDNPVDPKDVVYYLYMKNGMETLRENEEVLVVESDQLESPGDKRGKRPKSRGEEYHGPKEGYFFTEFCKRFPGIIRKIKGKGLFDILYDDGSYEPNVPRYRIKANKSVLPNFMRIPIQIDTKNIPNNYNNESPLTARTASTRQSSTFSAVSPKKIRLLERQASWKKEKSAKYRLLHDTKNQAMPMQGISMLRYDPLQFTHFYHRPQTTAGALPPLLIPYETDSTNNGDGAWTPSTIATTMSQASNSEFFNNLTFVQEVKAQTEKPTVVVDSDWQLVYMGPETSYGCSHLIPQDVLEDEIGVQAGVMFAVQVQGVDFPRYERSRLSHPVILYTINPDHHLASAEPTKTKPQINISSPTPAKKAAADGEEDGGEESVGYGMSRTKKDLISAIVNGNRLIQIEKRGHYTYSEGVGNHFD